MLAGVSYCTHFSVDAKTHLCVKKHYSETRRRLAHGAVGALLVAASGAGGADDNHATALATVLVGGHVFDEVVF